MGAANDGPFSRSRLLIARVVILMKAIDVKVRTATGGTSTRTIFSEFDNELGSEEFDTPTSIINAYQKIVTVTVLPTVNQGNGKFSLVQTQDFSNVITATPGSDNTPNATDILRFTLLRGDYAKTFSINNPAIPTTTEDIVAFLRLLVNNSNYDAIKEAYIRTTSNNYLSIV